MMKIAMNDDAFEQVKSLKDYEKQSVGILVKYLLHYDSCQIPLI
jgi:predicted CopG family antitoxin